MVAVLFLFKLVDVTYLNEPCFVAEGYRGSFILKETFTRNQWNILLLSFPDPLTLWCGWLRLDAFFHRASGRVLKRGRRPHRFAC